MLKFFLVAHLTYENHWGKGRSKKILLVFLGHPTEHVKVFCITPKYFYFIIFSFGSQTLFLILSLRKGVASQNMTLEFEFEEYQQF